MKRLLMILSYVLCCMAFEAKAEFEISKSPEFDHKVVNDDLANAVADTRAIIDAFLKK